MDGRVTDLVHCVAQLPSPHQAGGMLAFRMKKPLQHVYLDKCLRKKLDQDMWGPPGLDVLQKVDGMREHVRAIDAYTETGAAECREVFGRARRRSQRCP